MSIQTRPWVFSEDRGVYIANFVRAVNLPGWLSGKFIAILSLAQCFFLWNLRVLWGTNGKDVKS